MPESAIDDIIDLVIARPKPKATWQKGSAKAKAALKHVRMGRRVAQLERQVERGVSERARVQFAHLNRDHIVTQGEVIDIASISKERLPRKAGTGKGSKKKWTPESVCRCCFGAAGSES